MLITYLFSWLAIQGRFVSVHPGPGPRTKLPSTGCQKHILRGHKFHLDPSSFSFTELDMPCLCP